MEALLRAVLIGFALLFLLVTKDYGSTAALFPRVVALFSLGFIALDIFALFYSRGNKPAKPQAATRQDLSGVSWSAALALQAGYIGMIYVAGFSTATFAYLIACPWQLRYRNWPVTILHATLLTVAVVYTFQAIFHVRLPKGVLGIPW